MHKKRYTEKIKDASLICRNVSMSFENAFHSTKRMPEVELELENVYLTRYTREQLNMNETILWLCTTSGDSYQGT